MGISDAVAAGRLKDLTAAGILQKRSYREPGQRARRSMSSPPRGRDLLPALVALWQWGDTHLQDGAPPLELVDATNAPVRVAIRNERGEKLAVEDLHVRLPGSH